MTIRRFPTACRVIVLSVCAGVLFPGRAAAQPSWSDTVRFLQQSTFGPTTGLVERVQTIGFEAFLAEQFQAVPNEYPDRPLRPLNINTCDADPYPDASPAECRTNSYTMTLLQRHFFRNAIEGEDQLRQRVAFALSQIVVTSGLAPYNYAFWMQPYQQMLYRGAFGNYRQLLWDVTLNPMMGRYLDALNNKKFNPATGIKPNENYAREILQLFSIGVDELNFDGTPVRDEGGVPIPAYNQDTVEAFSRVFTGLVNAPPDFIGGPPNFRDPMVAREQDHDVDAKELWPGRELPAGQDTLTDISGAIDFIIAHPNTAPFMSKLLIQNLVTSNPSPGYVERVATKFASTLESPTQLFEVVRTILTDPEARGDVATNPDAGHLRQPVLFITTLLRALSAVSDGNLNGLTANMGQNVFNAPTVFNYYQFDYEVPGEDGIFGPEFQIQDSTSALRRANAVNTMLFGTIPGTVLDLSVFEDFASSSEELVTLLNYVLMQGTMSADMTRVVTGAVETVPASDTLRRVRTAIYLIATSSQYQVEQ